MGCMIHLHKESAFVQLRDCYLFIIVFLKIFSHFEKISIRVWRPSSTTLIFIHLRWWKHVECLFVRKFVVHAIWYAASAAWRSLANSILPLISRAHSSFLSLHICSTVFWNSIVRTAWTSNVFLLAVFSTTEAPQKRQFSLKSIFFSERSKGCSLTGSEGFLFRPFITIGFMYVRRHFSDFATMSSPLFC